MAKITFTIPDNKLARIKAGMLYRYPNNEATVDPAWVDPQDGSLPDMIPVYSDNAWLKERIRRFIIESVDQGDLKLVKDNAIIGHESSNDDVS